MENHISIIDIFGSDTVNVLRERIQSLHGRGIIHEMENLILDPLVQRILERATGLQIDKNQISYTIFYSTIFFYKVKFYLRTVNYHIARKS